MKQAIIQAINVALSTLLQQHKIELHEIPTIQLERTRDKKFGDYACNIAMLLAKPCQKNPRELATFITENLEEIPGVSSVQLAGPGFINFFLDDASQIEVIRRVLSENDSYGKTDIGQSLRVHMELVSSNPTGPLHVGHGRLAAYGASLANILDTVGYQVHREYYVNDAGRQMYILAVSTWLRYLELFGEDVQFPLNAYQGDYVMDIAKTLKVKYEKRFLHNVDILYASANEIVSDNQEQMISALPDNTEENKESYIDAIIERAKSLLGDDYLVIFNEALATILSDIREDLSEFGVKYQAWFSEKTLHDSGEIERGVARLREAGHLYEKDGATWFRATDFGDEKDRVVIRDNGQPTYFAADIGYHLHKYAEFDTVLDVFGADHHGYGPRLFALYRGANEDPNRLTVLLVQFATLFRGKKKMSMSTRGGQFVTLRELRQEVGNDAARFFYVMRKHDQHMEFDLELAKAHSNENPVYYIQYAYARICSVFRQLDQQNKTYSQAQGLTALDKLTSEHERTLMTLLDRYPETLALAARNYEPAHLAQFLQELANGLHSYYNAEQFIVDDEDLRHARLCLISATKVVLANGLQLLGVSTPESM